MNWGALWDIILLILNLWKDSSVEKKQAILASLESHHDNITELRKARAAGDRTAWIRAMRGIKRLPDRPS